MAQIIQVLNDLFEGECTYGDLVAFAESVRIKLMESQTLPSQALANTREQAVNSPNLLEEAAECHHFDDRGVWQHEPAGAELGSDLSRPAVCAAAAGALWERSRRRQEWARGQVGP